ncbi:MAG: glutamate--tRNA ligase [Candidatus Berkelbacteria bacterium]
MSEEIRTRIAPSPTGFFHIGTARAALFNWLFTRRFGGKFILRIEDTDKERSTEEYEIDIMECMNWLGMDYDEGPETQGEFGPYRQSERSEIYKKYADQLLADGHAYRCYCTSEDLEAEKKSAEANHLPPKYSGKCRNLTPEQIAQYEKEGRPSTLRFKIEEDQPVKFKDLIKGPMEFDPKLFGDFVVLKSDGLPTFMFAGIVDDTEMRITHVIRGEDHLSNTPRQILLAQAMNLPIPEYGHLPMILNSDKTKMSKRKNPVSVSHDFRDQGYLPEAMINFMVLLGWSPSVNSILDGPTKTDELYTLKDLTSGFDLADIGKSPAIFDQTKLDYFNGYYIRQMDLGELTHRALPFLQKAGLIKKESEELLQIIALVQERLKKLSELPELTDFFFHLPNYEADLLIPKKGTKEATLKALEESSQALAQEDDFSRDSLDNLLRALAVKLGLSAGEVLWPIRAALSGKPASPGTFELLGFFGKDESLARMKKAIDMLK